MILGALRDIWMMLVSASCLILRIHCMKMCIVQISSFIQFVFPPFEMGDTCTCFLAFLGFYIVMIIPLD
jgi:hypothetical protein